MSSSHRLSRVPFRSILGQVRGNTGVPLGGCKYLQVDVPVDRDAVRQILPLGLWPTDPPMAMLTAARYETFPLGAPFRESAFNIYVNTPFGKGIHCAWIVVDDDRSLIGGRDFLGYPKKMADFSIRDSQGHVSATVSRLGKPLISIEADILEREEHPAPVYAVKHFNMGGPLNMVFFSPLWVFVARETIYESHTVKATLELGDSDRDPLARIVSGPPAGGRMTVLDSHGLRYLLPVGVTGGIRWFSNTFSMRYR
jgi:acetoacetate decarboxylase